MITTAEFTVKPDELVIEVHENEKYVWIRKDIHEVKKEEYTIFECQEVFFKTTDSKEDIENNLDEYFEKNEGWSEPTELNKTEAEQIAELKEQNRILTDCLLELSEIVFS